VANDVAELLDEGRRALEEARWAEARQAFESVLEQEESPDAFAGLGLALWFLGDVSAGIGARERAVDGYVRADRCDEAARVAVWVSHQHFIAGRLSAARGWLARAERAVEGAGLCPGRGWIAVERARHAETVEECAEHARRAMVIAKKTNADDLEVFAVSVLGRAEVSAGRRQEGMQLLEEAMAAASAGRVSNVYTLGEAYCNLIAACSAAGDWERATEWCELVDDFAREHEAAPLYGSCRTIHADVLLATGRWEDAERALQSALDVHARYVPELAAPTVVGMAELRVRQGRLQEAEQLLVGREEHPESLRALAHLRLAQGQPQVAEALLERGLRSAEDDAVQTAQLLAALVDARLTQGDIESADGASRLLADTADRTNNTVGAARAELAAARVHLATGRLDEAAESGRRSLASFGRLRMPFEVAEARLALARALAQTSPEVAVEEARAAHATFLGLGASRARDEAAGVLRELGAATGGLPRTNGELTAREQEVLGLLAAGMSNAQIAERLVISEKTAGHHVSHILAKLGVRNRAEAAAVAARSAATG
jgi:ATP/maltotriose-dependent transcriptional regulator MalT